MSTKRIAFEILKPCDQTTEWGWGCQELRLIGGPFDSLAEASEHLEAFVKALYPDAVPPKWASEAEAHAFLNQLEDEPTSEDSN